MVKDNIGGRESLLVIDDDQTLHLLIKKLLDKHYEITTTYSGEEALKKIKDGYRPRVILADQSMQGMSGTDLLRESISLCPDAIRVIITAYSEPKMVIDAINQGQCFMFIRKPFNNIEFVQSIRQCFNEYDSRIKNKNLADELKRQVLKLNLIVERFSTQFCSVVPSLMSVNNVFEKGYFTNHTSSVINIANALTDSMDLGFEINFNVIISALLMNHTLAKMPEEFINKDPNDLDENAAKEYFSYYMSVIDEYSSIKHLNKFAIILSRIWEHYDGTGLPVRMTYKNIPIESQIIQLAKLYHNYVYSLPDGYMNLLDKNGQIYQEPDLTNERRRAGLERILKNSYWFDSVLMDRFKSLIKSKSCKSLNQETKLIRVHFKGDNIFITHDDIDKLKFDPKEKIYVPVEKSSEKDEDEVGAPDVKTEEATLNILEVRPGMYANGDLQTKYGRLLAFNYSLITEDLVNEIKRLYNGGLMNETVNVLVPGE